MPGSKPGERRGGRKPGTPNKVTASAKAAIGLFVDKQTDRLESLLTQIEANDGPRAAWQCIMDLVEYHVPKLARTELTGNDGKPLFDGPIAFVVKKQAGADNHD